MTTESSLSEVGATITTSSTDTSYTDTADAVTTSANNLVTTGIGSNHDNDDDDDDSNNNKNMNHNNNWTILKFVPFASYVESSFWVRYCREKLETIQLNEQPISFTASYNINKKAITTTNDGVGSGFPRLQCEENSLLLQQQQQQQQQQSIIQQQQPQQQTIDRVMMYGNLIGYNTFESFQTVDKNNLLRNYFLPRFLQHCQEEEEDNSNNQETASSVESILLRVLLITYADLKNHKVVYWFGIPSLIPCNGSSIRAKIINDWKKQLYYPKLIHSIQTTLQQQQQHNTSRTGSFFIYSSKSNQCLVLSKQSYINLKNDNDDIQAGESEDPNHIIFIFLDPIGTTTSTGADDVVIMMGWPLRNLIAYLSIHLHLGGKHISVVSYRPRNNNNSNKKHNLTKDDDDSGCDESILLKVEIPTKEDYGWQKETATETTTTFDNTTTNNNRDMYEQYRVVGWELNIRSKPGPRNVNLRPLLDSNHLAIQAADLNLKLMKWRMIPTLNIDKLFKCKVLLIGAGTLGCSVSRTLLGWGVRKIKLIDYGKVNYSNPVRQNLFTLEDCHAENGSGKSKSQAAADALKTIAADVDSEGIVLSIPMPGHIPDNAERLKTTIETLDTLVQESDVIFLLTDTRESRWLPTVIAAAYNKLLINAALGLDSWLVMRHGGGINTPSRYGCYFCNDVVAPENSTKNRTLDQQCTVTRPGLAPIASSMAVELMVSLLHHPNYIAAPAPVSATNNFSPTAASTDSNNNDNVATSPLGVIPHQIRGSLVSYTMMIPTVPAFQQCTACSKQVVEAYITNKIELVTNTCESMDGMYLENLSGLAGFRDEAASKMDDFIDEDWDDE